MISKIKDAIEKYSMVKKGDKVLLCVSGGPDSVAMLYAFYSISKYMRLRLFIAHLNHHLRPKESDKDEKYVMLLAKRLKIPVIVEHEDVGKFARAKKLSIEDAARRLRYNFFTKVARSLKIGVITTAHTRDDQAETVLMRLLRGTGLRGLRGILPKSNLKGFGLIRPLINISRKEVENYLRQKRIRPRLDSSNFETKFYRNKLRLELIPFLEKNYNPRIKELLSKLSDLLSKDYEYIDLRQGNLFRRLAKIKKEGISFDLRSFKKEDISTERALARNAIERLKGNLERIDYRHWDEIEDLIFNRRTGSIVDLPGNISVQKTKSTLKFYTANEHPPGKKSISPIFLNIPGKTRFGTKVIKASMVKRPKSTDGSRKAIEYFDMNNILSPLTLRSRQPGDKMLPLGMKGYKKISDILVDEKVSLRKRDNIPILLSADGEIIWLSGIRISEKGKLNTNTKNVLRLELL
ncbi:MAG: tRNA lysidine(34) synthetase TilS [Candidatus Omnitrophica bacterium]|nr:tRNA lysidine(34) synthetase TilS [Candidatus Omnitrophota bacterium]